MNDQNGKATRINRARAPVEALAAVREAGAAGMPLDRFKSKILALSSTKRAAQDAFERLRKRGLVEVRVVMTPEAQRMLDDALQRGND